jgi:MoaA/NifB/PqqE/SkfB family radical SAM enzyme
MTGKDVTLLWALRSPCNLGCRYCYFGTIEEHRETPPDQAGTLSHLSRTDLDLDTILAFVATLPDSRVRRIFLAGGELLIWRHALRVMEAITAAGVQTVVCTNGIPLNRPENVASILDFDVDAVSVSLDSADAGHNDTYRPSRGTGVGFADVVAGIRAVLTARATRARPRVGIYSVITRRNIDAILTVATLAADLGCDYFVPQPISLADDHPLRSELSLTAADTAQLRTTFDQLYRDRRVRLPASSYPDQFVTATSAAGPGLVRGCFGGRTLFFVEPDGTVWDCPSTLRIGATAPPARRTIAGHAADEVFAEPAGGNDCPLFSVDCVNMWPLMGFGGFLPPTSGGGS